MMEEITCSPHLNPALDMKVSGGQIRLENFDSAKLLPVYQFEFYLMEISIF